MTFSRRPEDVLKMSVSAALREDFNFCSVHLQSYSESASYISRTSQNESSYCCGKFKKDVLIKNIKGHRGEGKFPR